MNKRKHKFRLAGLVMLCLALVSPGLPAALAETAPGFVVRAVLPENQMDTQSYFSLLTPPGHEQTLEVEAENHLSQAITLKVEVTGAYSGPYGIIVYENRDEAMPDGKKALPDLLSLNLGGLRPDPQGPILAVEENRITLAPGASVRFSFDLRLPEGPLDGQLLGGIKVTRMDDPAQVPVASSFAIGSLYSYAIAVQLQSRSGLALASNIALREVSLSEQAGFSALVVSLDNRAAKVMTGAEFRVRLQNESGELLLDQINPRVSMAPYTSMPYTITLPVDMYLAPGAYPVTIDLTHEGQTQTLEAMLQVS